MYWKSYPANTTQSSQKDCIEVHMPDKQNHSASSEHQWVRAWASLLHLSRYSVKEQDEVQCCMRQVFRLRFPNEALNASRVTPQREHVHHKPRVEPETCSTILERSSVSGHIMTKNFGKTRTAEVTICIISERTVRSSSTVTALLKELVPRMTRLVFFKIQSHSKSSLSGVTVVAAPKGTSILG